MKEWSWFATIFSGFSEKVFLSFPSFRFRYNNYYQPYILQIDMFIVYLDFFNLNLGFNHNQIACELLYG